MTTAALEHRLAEIERELASKRGEYERMRVRVKSVEYLEHMMVTVGRIAEIAGTMPTERPDLQALIAIGRIQEITQQFIADLKVLEEYERLQENRRKIERGLA